MEACSHGGERLEEEEVLYSGPVTSEEDQKRPLVVLLNGGPHSAVSNTYTLTTSLFLAAGYSVLAPNYAGSLGVGKRGIEALPGRAGRLDVRQCHREVEECLQRFKDVLNPKNVFLYGGSHGGLLLGASPGGFCAPVISRNLLHQPRQ